MSRKLNVIDLFAGAGGMTEGFAQAGCSVLASLEWDHDACETHRVNHPDTKVIEGDINIPSTKAALTRAVSSSPVDVVVGGPPCQGFSLMGTRLGTSKVLGSFIDDPRNVLYKEYVKIVKKHKPKVFIMENVPGLFSYKKGQIKNQIIQDFSKMGYTVDVNILNAADYGVPQLRNRVIFMGNNLGLKNVYPEKIHYDPAPDDEKSEQYVIPEILTLRHIAGKDGQKPYITTGEAISDLPALQAGEGVNTHTEYASIPQSNYQRLMRCLDENDTPRHHNVRRNHEFTDGVYNHECRRHNQRDIQRYEALREGGIFAELPAELRGGHMPKHFKDKYRKLHSQKPSYTIVAHLYKDGNAFVHPDRKQKRTLTVREAARIQSFPDDFFFTRSRTSQFKQVGNAVPPILARCIAESARGMLGQ